MLHKAWNSKGEMPYCFPRSSIKFQGHTGQNITDFDPNWVFPDYRPVAAFKSLRFALFLQKMLHSPLLSLEELHVFIVYGVTWVLVSHASLLAGWEGGDEWIRGQFRLYLLSMLASSQQNGEKPGHQGAINIKLLSLQYIEIGIFTCIFLIFFFKFDWNFIKLCSRGFNSWQGSTDWCCQAALTWTNVDQGLWWHILYVKPPT